MRVIDPGPDPKVERQHVCKSCGATLGYLKPDVCRQDYKDIDGGSDTQWTIKCPQCNETQSVKEWY